MCNGPGSSGRRVGDDECFMAAALALAERGRGAVEPNPMVGAVIVRDGVEIARGWHRRFGGPHAEVEALAAARQAGVDVRGATMYVTLEPCCHHGKTPPCADAIARAGIARVVAAMADPDEKVSGNGLARLRRAGVRVDVGVCGAEARKLLAAYRKLRTTGRPWVICKWAQTADGRIALPPGAGRWISGPAARGRVHELRGICDGVCVGIGTVLADDPLLTDRRPAARGGRQPIRIVLDSALRLPAGCRLVKTARACPVMLAATAEGLSRNPMRAETLRSAGVEILELAGDEAGRVSLPALLDELGRRQHTRLLVEGGAEVLAGFVFAGLADELLAFVSPRTVSPEAGELPRFDVALVSRELSLTGGEEMTFGEDRLVRYVLGE